MSAEYTTDFTAGWSNGWLSANRYTAQNAALVAPGQIGFFIYNFTVPAAAPAGEHRFYGREVIDGVTFMEDYGYYQSVTVQASTLTATFTPASPSSNTTPVVSGTGAPAAGTVTVSEGATTLCTATADASGNYSCTVSTLAAGSHTITVSSTNGSTTATYVVDTTKPTVTGASAPNTTTVVVNFSEAMNCTTDSATNTASILHPADYTVTATGPGAGGGVPASVAANADCTAATLTFLAANALSNGAQYTVTVTGAKDIAGNTISSTANTATFLVADATAPVNTSDTASAPTGGNTDQVTFKFNEPINCATAGSSFSVNGVAAPVTSTTSTSCTVTTTTTMNAGTTNTGTSFGIKDLSGNLESPNPTTLSFTVATTSGTFTQTGAAQGSTNKIADVTFNGVVQCAAGVPTAGSFTVTQGSTNLTPGAATCDSTNTSLVHVPFTVAPTYDASGNATITVCSSLVKDQFGTVQTPACSSYTSTKDTTAPTLTGLTATTTTGVFTATWSEPITVSTGDVTCTRTSGTGSDVYSTNVALQTDAGHHLTAAQGTTTTTTYTATTPPIVAGTYSCSFSSGAVKDVSFQTNSNPATTMSVTATAPADATSPKVCTVAYDGAKTLTIVYSETMKTAPTTAGSITNPATYTYDGGALPAANIVASSTVISLTCSTAGVNNPTNNTATITLVSTPTTAAHTLGIVNAADLAGNTVSASAGFTGGTASTATITP